MTTSVSTRSPERLNPTRQQLDELDALLQRMLDLPVHPLDEPEEAEAEIEEPLPPVLNHDERPEPPDDPLAPVMNFDDRPAVAPSRPLMSYMVVETASPRPLPPASGFEPRQPASRLVPVTPQPESPAVTPARNKEEETRSEEQPSPLSLILPPHYAPTAEEPSAEEADVAEQWVPLRSTWQPSPQTWPPLAESWHQANGGTPPLAAFMPNPDPRFEPAPLAAPVKSEEPEVRKEEQPSPQPAPAQPQLSLSVADAPATAPIVFLPLLWFNQGFDACLAPLGAPGRWICGSGRSVLGLLGLACLAAAVILVLGIRMPWTW